MSHSILFTSNLLILLRQGCQIKCKYTNAMLGTYLCSKIICHLSKILCFSFLNLGALFERTQSILRYEILFIPEQMQWDVSMTHHMKTTSKRFTWPCYSQWSYLCVQQLYSPAPPIQNETTQQSVGVQAEDSLNLNPKSPLQAFHSCLHQHLCRCSAYTHGCGDCLIACLKGAYS